MSTYHESVFLQEAVDFLNIRPSHRYIDATLGGGGHTKEMLRHHAVVLGIDTDQQAIDFVKENITDQNGKLTLARGNFRNIDSIARENGFGTVNGILFDLGVSSYQLDTKERGFSFQKDAALDMRMDQSGLSGQVSAKDLVNALSKKELYELFTKFGEERFAHTISNNIISTRRVGPIETTSQLAGIIEKSYKGKDVAIHPATKVFQALRIVVNDELHALNEALPKAVDLLEKKGRLVVISFHSLEDRIVKNEFNKFEEQGLGKVLTKKPVDASDAEVGKNKRARSAKMRVFEKEV